VGSLTCAERRKKRQKWSLDDKANWAADQLTHGDLQSVHQVFPELMSRPSNRLVRIVVGSSLIQGQTVTNIYTSQIKYEIQRRHHFLIMGCNDFPISFSKQLKTWRQHNQTEYLTHRHNTSTRNIPWTELTIEFSQRTLRKLSISSTQITKLIYDKYWNKQYCASDQSCPLCMQGPDTREHLLICSASEAQSISHLQNLELAKLPIPKQIYQITATTSIDRCLCTRIKGLVTTDSLTRLGLFTHEQQDALIELIDSLHLESNVVMHIGPFIQQCVLLTAQALFDLISLRNAVAYTRKISNEEHQIPKPTGSRFTPLYCDVDIQYPVISKTLQVQYGFPRCFLQVPRAQAQAIFTAEGPHLLGQLLNIATNATVPLLHTTPSTVCKPFGQILVGRQRILVSYPNLDDNVVLFPREHISDYSCDACDYKTTFHINYPQEMPLIDCQTLSLKIAQDYHVLPILKYIFQ
jgi:hypothetical protein